VINFEMTRIIAPRLVINNTPRLLMGSHGRVLRHGPGPEKKK
jgi:hypothetical protein